MSAWMEGLANPIGQDIGQAQDALPPLPAHPWKSQATRGNDLSPLNVGVVRLAHRDLVRRGIRIVIPAADHVNDRVAHYVQDASGNAAGEADGVSGNGQFVVGSSYPTDDGSGASWRMNVATGELVALPGMPFTFGVSDDGTMVVGATGFFDNPPRALTIWTEVGGSQLFADYLAARNIEVPAGWTLQGSLSGISGDGSIIGGWAFGPDFTQSFIVSGANGPVDKLFADGFDPPPPPNPVQDGGFDATTASGGTNPFWDRLDGNPGAAGGTSFDSAADFGIPTHGGGWTVCFGG